MHASTPNRMAGQLGSFTLLRKILELLNDNLGRLLHGILGVPEIVKVYMNVLIRRNWNAGGEYMLVYYAVSSCAFSSDRLEG